MAIIGYFLIAERRLHRLLNIRLLGGVALTILVAGPWYALVGAETHGERFSVPFGKTTMWAGSCRPWKGIAGRFGTTSSRSLSA